MVALVGAVSQRSPRSARRRRPRGWRPAVRSGGRCRRAIGPPATAGSCSARSTDTVGPVRRVGRPALRARPSTSASRSGGALVLLDRGHRRGRRSARPGCRSRSPCRATSARTCRRGARPPRCSAWTSAPSRRTCAARRSAPTGPARTCGSSPTVGSSSSTRRGLSARARGRPAAGGACRPTGCRRVRRAPGQVGDLQRAVHGRAQPGARHPVKTREDLEVLPYGQLLVEVVGLRDHAHQRPGLLGLGRDRRGRGR